MSRLARIEDWMDRAKLARFDSTELANHCGVSYSQLRRYFVKLFGETPQQWLTEARLNNAAQLLLTTGLSVKEIARDLHFPNESQLCHQFKKHFGCRPYEYKRPPSSN